MKIVINNTTYTALKDLSFAPETDIAGDRTPINEFSVRIITTDYISVGQYASLYDNADNLWAKYWVVYAERENADTFMVTAQSQLALLSRDMKDPVMLTNEPVGNVLDDIFSTLGAGGYTIDASLQSETLSGFCPLQSAKTRLQWVCFAIGAYVKTAFSDKVEIMPVGAGETLIPLSKTFWKPKVTYKDYVTAIVIIAYTFTQGEPGTTDEWVSDGTNTYIVTQQRFTLRNRDVPESAMVHVITFDDIMLVNPGNVSGLLSFFSTHYFKRMSVTLDVINNAEYLPGERVIVYTDENMMAMGYIDSTTFSFGTQARSRIELTPVENRECALLTVICKYVDDGTVPKVVLQEKKYFLPIGYEYQVQNLFIDTLVGTHRCVFRPEDEYITGVMPQEGATVTVKYHMALDLHKHYLHVVSVDEAVVDDKVVEIS